MLVQEPSLLDCPTDPILAMIASINGNTTGVKELRPGVYEIGHWSMGHMLPRGDYHDYPEFGEFGNDWRGPYGVCDSVDQLLEKYPELRPENPRAFVVSMTPVLKANQSADGGWRWHKWGAYIGTQNSQCEYLYDEPEIEKVYCFHIYERVYG